MVKRVQIGYYTKDPPNTKRVSRPSRWGNPFPLSEYSLEESLKLYRQWLGKKLEENPKFLDPLRGFDLGCFCKLNSPCHADIILDKLSKNLDSI